MITCRSMQFDAQSVDAIIAGVKVRTRRLVTKWRPGMSLLKAAPRDGSRWEAIFSDRQSPACTDSMSVLCPHGRAGTILRVREPCWIESRGRTEVDVVYDAGGVRLRRVLKSPPIATRWRPNPGRMPGYASRLYLEVTEVNLEAVQSIDPVHAVEEGWLLRSDRDMVDPVTWFHSRWDRIHGRHALADRRESTMWVQNPWVWALKFRVHSLERAALAQEAPCLN